MRIPEAADFGLTKKDYEYWDTEAENKRKPVHFVGEAIALVGSVDTDTSGFVGLVAMLSNRVRREVCIVPEIDLSLNVCSAINNSGTALKNSPHGIIDAPLGFQNITTTIRTILETSVDNKKAWVRTELVGCAVEDKEILWYVFGGDGWVDKFSSVIPRNVTKCNPKTC